MTWDNLDAYVDGELPPAEAEALRQKAALDPNLRARIATLSRLKASTRLLGFATGKVSVQRRSNKRWPAGLAAAAMLALLIAIPALLPRSPEQEAYDGWSNTTHGMAQSVSLNEASVPGGVIPDLTSAHLDLAYVSQNAGRRSVFLGYEGQHGCRLGLLIESVQSEHGLFGRGPENAFQARRWTAGRTTYRLLARGMDPTRFEIVGQAVELLTRERDPDRLRVALGQSPASERPCTG
jgi:hypothetical protein